MPEQPKNKFTRFFLYNNTVPIVFSIFFLSVGAAAASTEAVQNAVVQSTETVQSIDNTHIRTADLETFKIHLTINSIVEDEFTYLVRYSYNSIGIEDFVWKPVTVEKTLSVSKAALGEHDLGLYVAEQLGQVVDFEMQYLRDAQIAERALGATQKVVVKEYSGLIGKMLDAEAQVFAGYTPVIEEKVESFSEPTVTAGGIGSTSYSEAERLALVEEQRRLEAERHEDWLREQEKLRREEEEKHPPVEEQVRDILDGGKEEGETETGTSTASTTPPEEEAETEPTSTTTPPVDEEPPVDEPAPIEPPVVETEEPPVEEPEPVEPPAEEPPTEESSAEEPAPTEPPTEAPAA